MTIGHPVDIKDNIYLQIKMGKFFNSGFVLRWGLRFLIFILITFQLVSFAGSRYISTIVVYLSPFVLGAVTCGWICPAGLIQEIVFLKKFKIEIPGKIHKKLRWLRYIFMVTMITGIFVIPSNLQHGIGNLTRLQFAGAYIPIAFVIASVFINRFFCRYFCPFGAIAGVKSVLRPLTINRNISTCVNCKSCDKVCPMQIEISKVKSSCSLNCVDCFRCIEKCPKKSLQIGVRDYKVTFEEIKKNIL
jgi:polyferredoxin